MDTKNTKKRVAVVYDSLYPFSHGGIEKRNFEIVSRLKDKADFHFLSINYWEKQRYEKDGITYLGVVDGNGLYVRAGKNNSRRSLFFALTFAYKLFSRLVLFRYDVVHCDALPPLNVLVCFVYCVFFRAKLVVTWHEIWTFSEWRKYLNFWQGLIAYIVQQKALFFSPIKIFVSEFTRKRASFIHPQDVVIPNGVSFPIKRCSEKKYDIGFAGRMIGHKNPMFFVELCSVLRKTNPDFKAVMIGDGPLLIEISRKINELDLDDVVDIFTRLDDADYEDILCKIKTFVLPSEREGFGMVALEALLRNIPVVVLRADSNAVVSEFSDFDHLFVSDKLDIEHFVNAILKTQGLEPNNDSKQTVRYDWNEIARTYFDLIQD